MLLKIFEIQKTYTDYIYNCKNLIIDILLSLSSVTDTVVQYFHFSLLFYFKIYDTEVTTLSLFIYTYLAFVFLFIYMMAR